MFYYMIFGYLGETVSPIALSVLLIVYLITIELGDKRMREVFLPNVVVLMLLFCIMFVQNIMSKW